LGISGHIYIAKLFDNNAKQEFIQKKAAAAAAWVKSGVSRRLPQ